MTGPEQAVLLAQVGRALAAGAVGLRVSSDHGHFHLVTDAAAPRLTTGAADPLLPLLAQRIDGADQVDLAVAFAMVSGVHLIAPWFTDLLSRGGRLRIVVGDYMDVTEPAALQRLGFDPARNGHGGWFAFVRDMDDPVDPQAMATIGDLLRRIERERLLTGPAVAALLSLRQSGVVPEEGFPPQTDHE
jgi:hypothetical protein